MPIWHHPRVGLLATMESKECFTAAIAFTYHFLQADSPREAATYLGSDIDNIAQRLCGGM